MHHSERWFLLNFDDRQLNSVTFVKKSEEFLPNYNPDPVSFQHYCCNAPVILEFQV